MLPHLSLFLFGFLFGIKHAFDADHLAAVSVMTTKESKNTAQRAMQSGLYWGLGHTVVLIVAGMLMLSFEVRMSSQLELIFERLVALMLIFLGTRAIVRFFIHRKKKKESISHDHPPFGEHVHPKNSFWIGTLHGLAGSAALTLLVFATINSSIVAMLLIGIFGLGSILGMMAVTFLIGAFTQYMETQQIRIQKSLSVLAGVFSVIVGLEIIL